MSTIVTFLTEGQEIQVPTWVTDLPSFRRWSDQNDFPDTGRIWYIRGKVLLDMKQGATVYAPQGERPVHARLGRPG
jgi:hypothetical protein